MNDAERNRDRYLHHPFYCEENVWHLLGHRGHRRAWAALIVGQSGPVWMTAQRAAAPSEVIGWDYHVVAVIEGEAEPLVYDLDSRLPFPSTLSAYVEGSFPVGVPFEGRPRFRLLAAEVFLSHLRTDRRHMRSGDGSWLKPPPPWPPISPGESNLEQLLSLDDPTFGPWLDARALLARWGGASSSG